MPSVNSQRARPNETRSSPEAQYHRGMSRTSTSHWPCSIARTADLLGDAWTLLILRECFYGAHRFEQFVDNLGIGRATLTARLRRLTDAGLLETDHYSGHARRVDYGLTPKGRATLPILATLMRWGDDWLADDDGPPVELLDAETGEAFRPVVVDQQTMKPLPARVHVRPKSPAAITEAQRRRQG